MVEPIVKVENLSKQYQLGQRVRYGNLREEMMRALAAPFKRVISRFRSHDQRSSITNNTIWALKHVSFEVREGDVVGIVGRNGAGKTTLLKILSRITEPTDGRAELRGRVASLLEVGTGFHPELTGRENIFLNGSLLGMSRQEVVGKFDEIVAFAEIDKFLDTPVKRYSSGMYVRLAFAVAAHLEPEILVIDEVLAVGDAAFQKKCLGKMGDVARGGRTVLFVSHNMEAVQKLCTRAILLDEGRLIKDGDTPSVIDTYLENTKAEMESKDLSDIPRRPGFGTRIRIIDCSVHDSHGQRTSRTKFGEPFQLKMRCKGLELVRRVQFVFGINSIRQHRITTLLGPQTIDVGHGEIVEAQVRIPSLNLTPGRYSLTLGVRQDLAGVDHLEFVGFFEVLALRNVDEHIGRELVHYGNIQILDADWKISSTGRSHDY